MQTPDSLSQHVDLPTMAEINDASLGFRNLQFSECIDKLLPAWAQAQAQVATVVRDSKNPMFNSDFATLESTLRAVSPVTKAHNLIIVTSCSDSRDGRVLVITRLIHTSGQWVQVMLPMERATRGDPNQALGSVLTYSRRYSLQCLFSLNSEDKDLADVAVTSSKTQASPSPRPRKKSPSKKAAAHASEENKKITIDEMWASDRVQRGMTFWRAEAAVSDAEGKQVLTDANVATIKEAAELLWDKCKDAKKLRSKNGEAEPPVEFSRG
jgi:hypothetical protein